MARFHVFLVCLAFVASSWTQEISIIESEILFVDDLKAFSDEYPELELTPLEVDDVQGLSQVRYTYGSRKFGDRILAQGNNNLNYPNQQDAQLTLKYPQHGGLGNVLTFVEVIVDQTSNLGNAYVAFGGIGQRNIGIVVQAKRTLRFAYRATFFGL